MLQQGGGKFDHKVVDNGMRNIRTTLNLSFSQHQFSGCLKGQPRAGELLKMS